jgi:hypothetical protein
MLARKLLSKHTKKKEQDVKRILEFLCSESGSHDYTVTRQEARDTLGLSIETPTDELYALIRKIHEDFANELELRNPYDPNLVLGTTNATQYAFKRALIESGENGSHAFVTEGTLTRQQVQLPPNLGGLPPGMVPVGLTQQAITDNRQSLIRRMETYKLNSTSPEIVYTADATDASQSAIGSSTAVDYNLASIHKNSIILVNPLVQVSTYEFGYETVFTDESAMALGTGP